MGFYLVFAGYFVAAAATGSLIVATIAAVLDPVRAMTVRGVGVSAGLVVLGCAVPFQFSLTDDDLGRSVAIYFVLVAVACFVRSVTSGRAAPQRVAGPH